MKEEQVGVKFIGKSAFDAIYDANADKVYRTALHYSNNHHVAEEITQSVFMTLYENMENINMKAVSRWLQSCAKYMAVNYFVKSEREIPKISIITDADQLFREESAEDEYMKEWQRKENAALLDEILENLYRENERWYYAWTITQILEKPVKEVAQNMGISYDALRKMLSRINKWIEKNYEKQYEHLNKA